MSAISNATKAQAKHESARVIDTGISEIHISFSYPKDNPADAVHEITNCLAYLGVFDGVKK